LSSATIFYLTTVLVYGSVDVMACLGLNLQFGIAGVTNFGFIIYQAAGAYAAAVLSMPRDTANGGFQSYIGGLHLPFPVPWAGAAIAGALIAIPTGLVVRRSLRADYVGVSMLVTAVVLNSLVNNFQPFMNGAAGLALIPPPFGGQVFTHSVSDQWVYCAIGFLLCAGVYLLIRLITESPYGRSLRAMREDEVAAGAIGKNTDRLRMTMLVVGGAVGGLSGGLLVSFISIWAPSAWTYPETIILIAAIIIGGRGNQLGVVLGALLVPVGFLEATRFIPPFGPPGLVPALEWVVTGLLILAFLWFRPQGVIPERRRRLANRLPVPDRVSAAGTTRG
jgi:branched-chain amino acid transport system permease protein